MTTKYLKNVSTMLAVVSAVTEVDLDHINYSRHNMYSHVYLNNLLRREKSIWYSASGSGVSFITVHIQIWLLIILIRKRNELLAYFAQALSDIHTVKESTKTDIFIARYEHFTNDREIDVEVADGLIHAEEVGNKHFEVFLLELVEDKKSFF